MKVWKCPKCKRTREYKKKLVMKICYVCQVEMIIFNELKGGYEYNGSKKF